MAQVLEYLWCPTKEVFRDKKLLYIGNMFLGLNLLLFLELFLRQEYFRKAKADNLLFGRSMWMFMPMKN